jgi:shikimate dehydrogenase
VNTHILKPVAFIGPAAAETIQKLYVLEQRFLPLEVPEQSDLSAVLAGLEPLGFLGAILSGPVQTQALKLVTRQTQSAKRNGMIDAITPRGGIEGTSTLEDALLNSLEDAGFQALGAHAVILGSSPVGFAATQLARAGFKTITVVGANRPAAEKLAKALPAGVYQDALSQDDSRLSDVLERADVLVHASADVKLKPTQMQPYHTLLEASGETNLAVALERAGGQVIPYSSVRTHHLAAQLEFVTGWKFEASSFL